VAAGQNGGEQEDAVRRRELLAGALAGTAVAAVGTPATAQPAEPATAGDVLERALLHPPTAPPVPLQHLTKQLAAAREDFRAARYQTLGAALPSLLAAAEATRAQATPGRFSLAASPAGGS
jgi:hypothetical protein